MPESPSDGDRTYAALIHLTVLVMLVAGPLVLWLAGSGRSSFVDNHGRDAILFHACTLTLVGLLMLMALLGHGIILIMLIALCLLSVAAACALRAAWRADRGVSSGYPGLAWLRAQLARSHR